MTGAEAFQQAFARPLQNKQVPTLPQLQNWLTIDQTNEFQWNFPDFGCSQFAATLVLHARAQEWQMGWMCVYGYDTSTQEEWNHAFNAIVTTEGLVYIEPQTDKVWWYAEHAEMQSGKDYEVPHSDPPHTIHIKRIATVVNY